jgi:hypothetical protein
LAAAGLASEVLGATGFASAAFGGADAVGFAVAVGVFAVVAGVAFVVVAVVVFAVFAGGVVAFGAFDFTSIAFTVPVFAGAAEAPLAGAAAAVFCAASCFDWVVVAVGPCAPADGVFTWGGTGFCAAITGTTQAATTASEIRMLVDLVGCMLSLQRGWT